jgi:GNAT superfamily N-acetyltransferase
MEDHGPVTDGSSDASLVPPAPSFDTPGLHERVLDLLRRTVQTLAEEIRPVESGWVARTHDLPDVWTLNQVHIIAAATVPRVVTLAEEAQSDLPYRHVVVDDEATARQLEGHLGAAGWSVECELLMVLTAMPARQVDTNEVIGLDENEMLALMRRWLTEEHADITADGLSQMDEYNRREGRRWNEQCFGVLGRDGSPAATTKLRSDGTAAWVEDVYTVPEERGRGFARMLVTHATQLARSAEHDLTFIIADDNDWPKHLYADVGFQAVGKRWLFHRGLA